MCNGSDATTPACNGAGAATSSAALSYYAAWLGTAGPRIAASHATAPLPVLVEAVLDELTSAGKPFTAYDVTLVLRALFPHPQRALPHYDRHGLPGVQPEVHRQMAAYLAGGRYTVRTVYPNGVEPARLYIPVRQRRRGRGWITLVPATSTTPDSAPLPIGAWVVKNTSC
jgi:hypothetical protein